jgi:hypothetical protein
MSGLPLGLASGEVNRAIDGAGAGKRFSKKNTMVVGGTLAAGVAYPQI